MYKRMNFTPASSTIDYMMNQIKTIKFGGLDLQPSYQRAYIWGDDFKDKLIYSIIKSYPIGNISIRVLGNDEENIKGARTEVVDGQQRLTTIRDFIMGDYNIKSEWSRKIIIEIEDFYQKANQTDLELQKLLKKLKNKRGVVLKFEDLPEIIKGNIKNYNISVSHISDAKEIQIREYFRFLQNQERLRAGEIINSMPPTNLEVYINLILDKEKMLDVINFVDDRRDFDKIFYSIIGLFDGKISFGTTDKVIQNYVIDAEELSQGKSYVDNMITELNNVSNLNNGLKKPTRKRFLKYFLLLCGFGFVDFNKNAMEKVEFLAQLDDDLSVFFSAKSNAIDVLSPKYSNEIIEEFRLIALLSKGGHSMIRVENRMKILSHYINSYSLPISQSNIKPIELVEC